MDDPTDRLRRLRAVLLDLATSSEAPAPASPADQRVDAPAERLGLNLSAEIDRWMVLRGATHRTISVSRKNLSRCLAGENVTISTVADVADALGCDVVIRFHPRA